MKPLQRIARLSAAFLTSNLARGAIGFALALALARGLGVERFGRWILCTTWASTLTVVVDLGFGVLLARDGARADARHGHLLAGALAARLVALIPLAAILCIAAPALASEPESIAGLRLAALVAFAGAAYGCVGAIFRSQPAWLPAILAMETAWAAVQMGAAWLLVRAGAGIPALLLLMTSVQVAQFASAMALWRRAFDADAVRQPRLHDVAALVRRALPFAATGLVANLQTRLAPLMLGFLSTQTEVGALAAAARFGTLARLAPGAMFAGALPVLSREYSTDRISAGRTHAAFDRALVLMAIAIALPLMAFAGPLVRLVYGSSFAAAGPVLIWVGIALVPSLTNSARKISLYALQQEATALRWSAVSLALQIAAGAVLIPSLGAVGAAAAVAAAEAVIWIPLRRAARPRRFLQNDAPSTPNHAALPMPERWPQSATVVADR